MDHTNNIPSKESNRKYLLLTFDYELFLGTNSGSVQKCMIEPTQYILDILKEVSIKHAIFFVDTTYLQKLMESSYPAPKNDLKTISQQLIYLMKEGHYVFPHIHSHWKDAVYNQNNNTWTLENDRYYRFHFVEEEERDSLFKNSINIIFNLQKEAGINYPIDAYRAGGWCIQPFVDFKPHFEKYNICFDFSVLKGQNEPNEQIFFNFTSVPQKNIYKFSNEVDKEDVERGQFYEFTISSLKKSAGLYAFLERIYNKYLWLTKNKSIGDGLSLPKSNGKKSETGTEMASLELLTRMKLKKYERFLKDENYFQLISHPKMLSKHNIKTFKKFISSAKRKYDLITDYKLMLH